MASNDVNAVEFVLNTAIRAMLRFCAVCDNLLYEQLESQTHALIYACKCCGNIVREDASTSSNETLVMESNYVDDETQYRQFITPHLKNDPTLPRASYIPCIRGDKCTRTEDETREVIYVKYDAIKVKFLYHCVHCGAFWLPSKT